MTTPGRQWQDKIRATRRVACVLATLKRCEVILFADCLLFEDIWFKTSGYYFEHRLRFPAASAQ